MLHKKVKSPHARAGALRANTKTLDTNFNKEMPDPLPLMEEISKANRIQSLLIEWEDLSLKLSQDTSLPPDLRREEAEIRKYYSKYFRTRGLLC